MGVWVRACVCVCGAAEEKEEDEAHDEPEWKGGGDDDAGGHVLFSLKAADICCIVACICIIIFIMSVTEGTDDEEEDDDEEEGEASFDDACWSVSAMVQQQRNENDEGTQCHHYRVWREHDNLNKTNARSNCPWSYMSRMSTYKFKTKSFWFKRTT